MNRKSFASLAFSLALTLFFMGSLPLAASEAPYAPIGITETPVATETPTRAPTNTPTLQPAPTAARAPADTAVPPTATPTLTPATTPTPTRALVLPVTGDPAEPADGLRWLPQILALILGGLAVLMIGLAPSRRHTPRN